MVDWLVRCTETCGTIQLLSAAQHFLKRWELVPSGGNFEAYTCNFADVAES